MSLRAPLVAAVSMIAFAPGPAAALVETSCTALASYDPDVGQTVFDDDFTTGSCASSISADFASLNADGEAGVGGFLARAEATIFEGPIDDADTSARTLFRDTIVVSSPGNTGIARLRATAILNGVIDVTGTGQAGVLLEVFSSPGGTGQLVFESCTSNVQFQPCFGSSDPYPRIVSEVVDVEIDVLIGGSVTFGLTLSVSAGRASVLSTQPGTALSEFSGGGEVSWQGFTELTKDGSPIPFTITSESGTDWTQPVPEPGGTPAALAGIAALARRASRRAPRGRVL